MVIKKVWTTLFDWFTNDSM